MDPYFASYSKINSKYMKDLNVKKKHALKLLEENIGKHLCSLSIEKDFLTPKWYKP